MGPYGTRIRNATASIRVIALLAMEPRGLTALPRAPSGRLWVRLDHDGPIRPADSREGQVRHL